MPDERQTTGPLALLALIGWIAFPSLLPGLGKPRTFGPKSSLAELEKELFLLKNPFVALVLPLATSH